VFQDGFGERLADVAADSGDAIEVLTIAPALASVPGFGDRVAQRVARLSRVRHAMYARVRALEDGPDGALRLVSDRVEGWRLAQVLAVVEREQLALDLDSVFGLLRQLIPAVALFSRHQQDAAIGTVGPERLVLTPQGRIVVCDYVLAPGIEQLNYSRARLWRDLRVPLPPGASTTHLPPTADVVGIGVTALSLALGRLLREDEYLVSLGDLVDVISGGSAARPGWSPEFSSWLRRALQFEPQTAFATPHEAQAAFEEVLSQEREYTGYAEALQAFLSEYRDQIDAVAGAPPPAGTPRCVGPQQPNTPTVSDGNATPVAVVSAAPAVAAHPTPEQAQPQLATDASAQSAVPLTPPASDGARRHAATQGGSDRTVSATSARWRVVGIAAVLVACAEAGALGWLVARDRPALLARGELVVQSRPAAARVTIDGEERGLTPYTTELSAGTHILEIRVGRSEPRVIPLLIRAGVQSGVYVELQSVATVGALEVRSEPLSARVSVAGQYRGTTPLLVKDLPPGEIEVVIASSTRRVRQTVRIEPGITSQLVVPLDR
jgi:hypothetical protein